MEIKKDLNKTIFREYDIRGEYETQIDADTAYTIGLAYGTKILSTGRDTCVIGHDNRLSHEVLTEALIRGITSTGVNIKYLGLVTTPMYYFACLYLKIDTGIMVTASHNPVNDNGFKIALHDYDNACGQEIKDLYEVAMSGNFSIGNGTIESVDIKLAYLERILRNIKITNKLKVVIDPANATTSIIVHDIFDNMGIEPIYINDTSDGHFPNHHPDPSVGENMEQISRAVLEHKADVGLAFDGDGDRLGLVDEKGQIINIDTFMAIVWDDLMPSATNKTALFDVKCSKQLEDEIIALGGTPYIYRTGNSYQKNKIKEMDLVFGGELSGHVFFRDKWDGFDDGIYAGLRFLEILSKKNKPASELSLHLNKYYSTPEIKVAVREDEKFKIVEEVKKYCEEKNMPMITIDGVRAYLLTGWALVRASNTGPNLTLRFEASTKEDLEKIESIFTGLINSLKSVS